MPTLTTTVGFALFADNYVHGYFHEHTYTDQLEMIHLILEKNKIKMATSAG